MSSTDKNKDHRHTDSDPDPPPDYDKVVGGSGTTSQVSSRRQAESLPELPTKREVGPKGTKPQSDQNQVGNTKLTDLGILPEVLICSHCGHEVETRTSKHPTPCAWISCVLIGLFLSWICCFVPFCVDACNDVEHNCPHCGEYLGKHSGEC